MQSSQIEPHFKSWAAPRNPKVRQVCSSMFSTRRLILSLIVLSSLLAVNPKHTFACSCIAPGTPTQELESSTAVFAGIAVNLDIPNKGQIQSTGDPVIVTFQVSRVWKGPEHNPLTVDTVRSEISCGYEFQTGQKYLVYALGTETNLHVSFCSRTQLLSAASEDLKALGEGKALMTENAKERESNNLRSLSANLDWIFKNSVGYLIRVPNVPKNTQSSSIPAVLLGLIGVGTIAILVAVIRKRLSQKA